MPPYYDSLVAKVIALGPDRAGALRMMAEALGRCRIDGIPTTVSLYQDLVASTEFAAGGVDTGWLTGWLASRERPATARTQVS